jgi:quercetin dioxygenase-like cupin family protein
MTLSGRGEIELSDGTKIPVPPGRIVLAEDMTARVISRARWGPKTGSQCPSRSLLSNQVTSQWRNGMNMKIFASVVILVTGMLIGRAGVPTASAQLRTTNSTRVLTKDLGGWCEGKEVTVEINEAGPGTSGRHYHPAHSITYVLDGSEAYALEGQAETTVHAGDVLYEPPMQRHTVDNRSAVKLLVIRIANKGEPATVRLP